MDRFRRWKNHSVIVGFFFLTVVFVNLRCQVDDSGNGPIIEPSEPNGYSSSPSISSDGQFVSFASSATNLVADDNNGRIDIFVHDRGNSTTERVSIDSGGTEANDDSSSPSIGSDGLFVSFASSATNLVPDDNNRRIDIFVNDGLTGTTERVSIDSDDTEANDDSSSPSISSDGQFVSFASSATNLVPDDNNRRIDIFVNDGLTGTTERVSIDSDGTETNGDSSSPSISSNGRFVAFASIATNLVANDINGNQDIFIFDRENETTERVSIDSDGTEANGDSSSPSISSDGLMVAFVSRATNLVPDDANNSDDIFIFDRVNETTERVSIDSDGTEANGDSSSPSISSDGLMVAFVSRATNLVPDDANNSDDIFVFDRVNETTERVSVDSDGNEADGNSSSPSVASDSLSVFVSFASSATNLIQDDNNNFDDIFLHNRQDGEGTTERISVAFE